MTRGPRHIDAEGPPWWITNTLDDKTILVTGGTGSFGKKFVATVLERYAPHR